MHELYVVNVATATERQLTTGASEAVANGEMNRVYMEEVYGRGTQQAYWWSPDSTRIAFLQFDDTPVYPFGLINHLTDVQEIEFSRYPKQNPSRTCGLG